jgi:hypothetical protein
MLMLVVVELADEVLCPPAPTFRGAAACHGRTTVVLGVLLGPLWQPLGALAALGLLAYFIDALLFLVRAGSPKPQSSCRPVSTSCWPPPCCGSTSTPPLTSRRSRCARMGPRRFAFEEWRCRCTWMSVCAHLSAEAVAIAAPTVRWSHSFAVAAIWDPGDIAHGSRVSSHCGILRRTQFRKRFPVSGTKPCCGGTAPSGGGWPARRGCGRSGRI